MIKISKMNLEKIKISEIFIPPNYPRKELLEDKQLGISIATQGQITPIILDSKNFLIAGLRRLTEMRKKKYRSVWVIRHMDVADPDQRYLMSVVESLHKEDLNPIEKAMMFKNLKKIFGVTTNKLAKMIEYSKSSIDFYIKLLELPDDTKNGLVSGRIKPYELEKILFKHRIATHEEFLMSADEKKFNSVLSRLAFFKSDLSYANFNKTHLLNFKTKLEELLQIVNDRLKTFESEEDKES